MQSLQSRMEAGVPGPRRLHSRRVAVPVSWLRVVVARGVSMPDLAALEQRCRSEAGYGFFIAESQCSSALPSLIRHMSNQVVV
jgi:hypothetical protein